MAAVDKADAAQFTREEILDPQGWVLLNFLMDSRTGLGRFRDFRISNYELMMQLIEHCRDHSIAEVLALPDVRERIELYNAHREPFAAQLRRCTTVHGKLALIDLRDEELIYAGNRFMIYALYPDCGRLGSPDVGAEEAEHRLRYRQVDFGPRFAGRHRRALSHLRWRRSPGCWNLPDPQRPGRNRQGRTHRRAFG